MSISKQDALDLFRTARRHLRDGLFHGIGRRELRDLFKYESAFFLWEMLSADEKEILGDANIKQPTQTKDREP